jgi:hypothetical protein
VPARDAKLSREMGAGEGGAIPHAPEMDLVLQASGSTAAPSDARDADRGFAGRRIRR